MGYEFNEKENSDFNQLNQKMMILSVLIALGGIANIILFFVTDGSWAIMTSGILYLTMAVTFFLPLDNFKKIIHTEGNDIKELMVAFKELDKGWLIVNIVTALVVIVLIIEIFV